MGYIISGIICMVISSMCAWWSMSKPGLFTIGICLLLKGLLMI